MTADNSLLPYFEKPPVIETVMGVFVRPVRRFNSVWQGVFWKECLANDFPQFEFRPPTEEAVERFDPETGALSHEAVRWQLSIEPEVPRLWAKSATPEHILQVQRNALLSNWLRQAGYRRFHDRLVEFESRLHQFSSFVGTNDLSDGPLTPTSCTVTYINHIPVPENQLWANVLADTLRFWTAPGDDSWLPTLERGRVQFSFGFGQERGRLHVTALPAMQTETKKLVLQLELTGRVMLSENDGLPEAVLGLKKAHEWVVRGFVDVTRPEIHQHWGRIQ